VITIKPYNILGWYSSSSLVVYQVELNWIEFLCSNYRKDNSGAWIVLIFLKTPIYQMIKGF